MQQNLYFTTNSKFGSKQTITTAVFDITMREKHGAEVCELAGVYILNGMKSKRNGTKVGVYKNIDL